MDMNNNIEFVCMKKSKKAFVFSFLAIFISLLIFSFSYLYLYEDSYSQDNNFEEARILEINDEVNYFREVYLKNTLSISIQNVFSAISENKTIILSLDKNYPRLNDLVYEGLINGSFDGVNQSIMVNKTISYFLKKYEGIFFNNQRANLSYTLNKLYIYEEDPYYIRAQLEGSYKIRTLDNISSWDFNDTIIISFPILNLKDPEFSMQASSLNITVRPNIQYLSISNWTFNNFKESLDQVYSSIYFNPSYKYKIGSSFLNRLLNVSSKSYFKVLGSWNFEYDEEEYGVYDSSLNQNLSAHFGNSIILLNLNNNTLDFSAYSNDGVASGGLNCTAGASTLIIGDYSCIFDGLNDEITILKEDLDLSFTNKVSISAWINPKNYTDPISGEDSSIFTYGNSNVDVISLGLTSNGKLKLEIGSHVAGVYHSFNSTENISLNKWTHVLGVFNGDTGIGKIYIDGKLSNLINSFSFESSSMLDNFVSSTIDIGVANKIGNNFHFNGSIDELGVYSKVLDLFEIGSLFESKTIEYLDYKDTLHGRGVEFDGLDDYINFSNELDASSFHGNWSIELWFKPYNITGMRTLVSKYNPLRIKMNDGLIESEVFNSSGSWNLISGGLVKNNTNNYLTVIWNSSSEVLSQYLNSELVASSGSIGNITSNVNGFLYLAVNKSLGNPKNSFYNGIIEEFRIHNRSLSILEIERNYYNYNSQAKGCCNYLTLINPNLMGFNDSPYNTEDVSYSSKVFFDTFSGGNDYNITLYNITNITSNSNSIEYTNFIADHCIFEAYDIFSYSTSAGFTHSIGDDNFECSNLIKMGVY